MTLGQPSKPGGSKENRANAAPPVCQALCLSWAHTGKDLVSSLEELAVWQGHRCISTCNTTTPVLNGYEQVLGWEEGRERVRKVFSEGSRGTLTLGLLNLCPLTLLLALGVVRVGFESLVGKDCVFQESSLRSSCIQIPVSSNTNWGLCNDDLK